MQAIFFQFLHSSISGSKGTNDQFETPDLPIVPRGTQTWEEGTNKDNKYVGKSFKHTSGQIHGTGEAVYVGDIKTTKDCLHAAVVYSTVPHGNIKNINTEEAFKCDGVVDFISAKDFKFNVPSPLSGLKLLPDEEVVYYGQPIGIIVADTHENALRAVHKVKSNHLFYFHSLQTLF